MELLHGCGLRVDCNSDAIGIAVVKGLDGEVDRHEQSILYT